MTSPEYADQTPAPSVKPVRNRTIGAALIFLAALVIGGGAGAAIGMAIPGQAASELEDVREQLASAERDVTKLEAARDSLESEVFELTDELAAAQPEEPATPAGPRGSFPQGYPYEVAVAELPDQVRSWYEMSSHTQAVALAPGVWTPLPPGADIQAAIDSDVADGFCASVEAYERDFAKSSLAGTCW